MTDKLLIGISAPVVTAARWHGGKIAECLTFANDEGGQADFKEYLARLTDMPAHIMVDAVEEDYRFETLPHAFGGDRADMVARKLKQHYRNTPYMAAALLGRDTGKRRDDRYLFSALTNADLIAEWQQAVAARGMPIAGIYLLPMVSTGLVEKLDVKATNLLLVAQHATGLRLTFFRDRQFRLSRLTRGDSGRPENRARYFTEEISNTRLYLHALRTMTLDEHLTVLLIDRSDELQEEAAGVARDNPSLECVRVGRGELTSRLGIDNALLDASPYSIYLHLLGRALGTSPAIVIRDFGWKYGVSEIEVDSAGSREAAPPGATPAGPAGQRKESALIDGEVRPFRGDYRSAIITINSFASRIAEEPEVSEVRVVKLPLNVNPALSLSGNTLDNPEQGGIADFKLLLVLKALPK